MPRSFRKVQVWIWSGTPDAPIFLVLHLLPERGGHWQPVTGGVDEGETDDDAALRESTEETGLDFGGEKPERLGFEFDFSGTGPRAGQRYHETTYALRARGKAPTVRLEKREHTQSRWVSAEEARALLHFESNAHALEILVARLSQG